MKTSATSAYAASSAAVAPLAPLATFAAARSVRVYQHMHRQSRMGKRLRLRRRWLRVGIFRLQSRYRLH